MEATQMMVSLPAFAENSFTIQGGWDQYMTIRKFADSTLRNEFLCKGLNSLEWKAYEGPLKVGTYINWGQQWVEIRKYNRDRR